MRNEDILCLILRMQARLRDIEAEAIASSVDEVVALAAAEERSLEAVKVKIELNMKRTKKKVKG